MTSRNAVRRSVPKGELPDFTPVPRKPRHDGWTPERQRAFIEALADTGCVAIAARMVNMSKDGAYQLRRQPGAASFRAAWDAAQTLGLQPVKDEAFDRAMNGQLVPVFVAGKLMGFRRKKNDRLLMFILRHYGQDAQGRKTTVNYFSTRATAGTSNPPRNGEGDRAERGGGVGTAVAAAEASTTTVKTVISGPGTNAPTQLAADDEAATILNAFEGVPLDAEAQAEIYRTLEACAERRRALEANPENDPERVFIGERETTGYLGELESGVEGDWVEYRPEGEHRWEGLGEGGNAAEIDEVLRGMEERKQLPSPPRGRGIEGEGEPLISPRREHRPRKPYKKRTPKPPFTPRSPPWRNRRSPQATPGKPARLRPWRRWRRSGAKLRPPRRSGGGGGKAGRKRRRNATRACPELKACPGASRGAGDDPRATAAVQMAAGARPGLPLAPDLIRESG